MKNAQRRTDDDPTLSSLAGESLAVLQHGIDKVAAWGFTKMKDVSKETEADRAIENPALKTAAKAGRGIIGFLGSAGSAYYRKYEELKKLKS